MLNFGNNKVLAIFKCGSHAFGFADENSDNDYFVILEPFQGSAHEQSEENDYFVYGKEAFKKIVRFEENVPDYDVIYNDQFLDCENKFEFVDPEFKDELFELLNIDWKRNIYKWVKRNIHYYSRFLTEGSTNTVKSLYHLIRIKDIVVRFEETGEFNHNYSQKAIDDIKTFKANFENPYLLPYFRGIITYLDNFLRKEKK